MNLLDIPNLSNEELDIQIAERVFGIDLTAHDDASKGKATFHGFQSGGGGGPAEMEWNGTTYHVAFTEAYNQGAQGNWGHGLYWWNDRIGKPWQKDLEVHVAAWRERAYEYSTDPSRSRDLRRKMVADGWTYACGFDGHSYWADFSKPPEGWRMVIEASTEERAVARAALFAMVNCS